MFNIDFASFHFQYPQWFFALLPLVLLLWLIKNNSTGKKSWENIIDPKLLPLLLRGTDSGSSNGWIKPLIGFAWLISIIALADPVWQKIPQPVFQTNSARVIILDLSNSMFLDDIKPTRLSRARFKIEDILTKTAKETEGQVGLVVFAGSAFTASPLTRDAATIKSLLRVLTPEIMPSQGSRLDLGITKAHELLKQAGVANGQVIALSDGASNLSKAVDAAQELKANGHSLSILAVGTKEGGVLKFNNNKNVTVTLNEANLLKIVKTGGGVLHKLTNSEADIKAILSFVDSNSSQSSVQNTLQNTQQVKQDENSIFKTDDWVSTGPLISLLLLPFAALAFRKGWLFNVVITIGFLGIAIQPQDVFAESLNENLNTSSNKSPNKNLVEKLQTLFENDEQRASKALKRKQYDKVNELSENPLLQGSASFKKADYEKALESFKQSSTNPADSYYNEGNTLAKLEKYEEAIKAYDKALKESPEMEDAIANKKSLEEFLKQKKKNEEQQKKDSEKNNEKNKDQEKQDGESKDGEGSESQDQSSDGKESKNGKKGEQSKEQKENQFSDANKALDEKEKNDDGDDESSSAQEQKDGKDDAEKSDKAGAKKSDDENSKQEDEDKAQKLADSKNNESSEDQDSDNKNTLSKGKPIDANELSAEEKIAAEQWLRRIPDDPGGLLRRKFKYQYKQQERQKRDENPW